MAILAIFAVLAIVSVVMTGLVLITMKKHQAEMAELRRLTGGAEEGAHRAEEKADSAEQAASSSIKHVGIVVNPSKFDDPDTFQQSVRDVISAAEGSEVSFFETTVEDPGKGPAQQAVEAGCDLVIAAGGDGTVRMVASALAGTDVRMAIIPAGTGNLLARNIEVPLDTPEAAVLAAITGRDRTVDIGWLRHGNSEAEAREAEKQAFLVMAGYGADAEMISNTDGELKKRFGWIAYVVGGVRSLLGRNHDVVVSLPNGKRHHLRARTVLVGNVGKLPGGIVLMPDASIDNGKLEVLVAGWRGPAGFSQVLTKIVNPRLKGGVKLSTMEYYLTTSVRVSTTKPQPVQLDGDSESEATHLIASVDVGALTLRVPSRD